MIGFPIQFKKEGKMSTLQMFGYGILLLILLLNVNS